jgi:DNA invertase Pin-like site-specific DNA recombinase
MTVYYYAHVDSQDPETELNLAKQYAQKHHLTIDQHIQDPESIKINWSERKMGQIFKSSKPGDIVIIFEASQISCSTSQILEILSKASEFKIQLHFVKYNAVLKNDTDSTPTTQLLSVVAQIESDYISKRTTQALARRKAAGLPLGRPKGRGNKSLKLDRFKDDIKKYLSLGVSKASIAKLVDCHPQTLYDWLDRNGIDADKYLNMAEISGKA